MSIFGTTYWAAQGTGGVGPCGGVFGGGGFFGIGRIFGLPFGGILLLALAVALALTLVTLLRGRDRQPEAAQDILDRRYAAGEIDQELYDRMRRDIYDR